MSWSRRDAKELDQPPHQQRKERKKPEAPVRTWIVGAIAILGEIDVVGRVPPRPTVKDRLLGEERVWVLSGVERPPCEDMERQPDDDK